MRNHNSVSVSTLTIKMSNSRFRECLLNELKIIQDAIQFSLIERKGKWIYEKSSKETLKEIEKEIKHLEN